MLALLGLALSVRIVTMPIQSQGIITRDNVSVDVSAVAYYRVVDATKSVVAVENVAAAINQIAQTTLRKVVGQHTLDQTLAETDTINVNIREILDVQTEAWGVVVTLVELKDIQLPDSMQRAMARQAEAEREKRAKIIAAEGEALAADQLGVAADVMMAPPAGVAAAQPAEPGGDRRRQEHHGGVPGAADEHHPGARRVPGQGSGRRYHITDPVAGTVHRPRRRGTGRRPGASSVRLSARRSSVRHPPRPRRSPGRFSCHAAAAHVGPKPAASSTRSSRSKNPHSSPRPGSWRPARRPRHSSTLTSRHRRAASWEDLPW